MDNAAELFRKWQGWINYDLLRSFQDIFIFNHIADGFNESLKPLTGTTPEWSDLVMWMSVNYIGNFALAIRRLGDHGKDTISLYRLLADVKKHAAVVTPENLAAYRGNIGPREPVENVEATLDSDMRSLVTSGDAIRMFVNKMVAHAAEDAHTITPPTYGQFNDAVRVFHGIYRKWALFLAGMSCQIDDPNPNDLLPSDPPEYASQFAKMWRSLGE